MHVWSSSYGLTMIIELNDVDGALRSLSLGNSTPFKELVRSSNRKKKKEVILDVLLRSSENEKPAIFLEWLTDFAEIQSVVKTLSYEDKPIAEKRPDLTDAIPLQDRESAMGTITSFCKRRFLCYHGKTKQDHGFLTLFGPSGSGKTRLSREALKIFEERANNEVIYLQTCSPAICF